MPNLTTKDKKAASAPQRRGRPMMLGALSAQASSKALGKRGFASANVINRWAEIVGQDMAAFTVPLEIKFPRHHAEKATLVLQVSSGAAATLLQMKAPVLLERINGFLGTAALGRIEAQQGPLPRRVKRTYPEPPPLSPEDEAEIKEKINTIVSPEIRSALLKLGTAIARRARQDGNRGS